MKQILLISMLLLFCAIGASAQVAVKEVIFSNTDPVGTACVDGRIYVNRLTGVNTERINGVCTAVTSGGTPGTVTSVTGTANQINVATGTTTPVLSLSSTLIAPGTVVATTTITTPQLTLGTVSTTTGGLRLANSGSAFLTTLQAGNAAAARTYTWPTNFGAAGTVLTDAAGNGTLSWAAASTAPGGSDTQVQFNNSGAFGGSANLTWTSPTLMLAGASLSGPDVEVKITGDTFSRVAMGINTSDVARIGFGSGAAARNAFIEYVGAGNLKLGGTDADLNANVVAQISSVQNVLTGGTADQAGKIWTFVDSGGKGTGVSGGYAWQVHPAGSTGTSLNAAVTALTLDSTKLVTFSGPIALGGSAISFGALPSGATTSGTLGTYAAQTYTVTGTNTATAFQAIYHGAPTFTDASAGTVTDLFSENWVAPAIAGSLINTRKHTIGILDSTSAASSITGGLVVAAAYGTTATSVGIGGGNVYAGADVTAGSGNFVLGAANGNIYKLSATNGVTQIMGGTSGTPGGLLSLYGSTHATKANIAEFTAIGGVTVNVGQTTSATTDLLFNPTSKTSGNFWDAQVNSVSKGLLDFSGALTLAGGVTAGGVISVPSATFLRWASSTTLSAPTNSNLILFDSGRNTFNALQFGGTSNSHPAVISDVVNGFTLQSAAGTATWNDASTAGSGTVANRYLFGVNSSAPTLTATNASVTYTVASTLYVPGAPSASTNVTIGTAYALNIAAGNVIMGSLAGTGSRAVLADANGVLSAPVSDSRLKKNVQTMDGDVLSKLSRLRGVYFDFVPTDGVTLTNDKRRQIGMIADEVEKVIPEAVGFNAPINGTAYRYLNYDVLIPFLIEAVKAQQKEIETLKTRIH